MKRVLTIMAVTFKRTEGQTTGESGILINEGSGPIIDMDGKVVESPVWDYRQHPTRFCVQLPESE